MEIETLRLHTYYNSIAVAEANLGRPIRPWRQIARELVRASNDKKLDALKTELMRALEARVHLPDEQRLQGDSSKKQ